MANVKYPLSQIKKLEDLVHNVELIQRDLYNLISSLEVRVSDNGNRPKDIRPRQLWHDKNTGQVWFYAGGNSDILLG